MDQVKAYLKVLKKHHFWLLVSLAALFGVICWWMGANSLATEYKKNFDTVNGSFQKLKDVQGKSNPPNSKFAAGVNEKNDGLKQKVLDEWRERYDQQQKLFAWPECVAADMAKLQPGAEITDENVRRRYKNLAYPGNLEKVLLTADYRRPVAPAADAPATPATEGAGGDDKAAAAPQPAANPDPAAIEEMEGLVVWAKAHVEQLRLRYNLETDRSVPSSQNILFVQEDMWMLENLASVVRKTNEGAADVGAAPIKRIDTLEIAQWAIADAQREAPKIIVTTTEGGTGRVLGGNNPAGGAQTEESTEDRAKKQDDMLRDGRYLNDQGEPLMAADAAPFAEFNLMFVRMKVVIDQRKIPELLVNCANAPIPIEVVRFSMFDPVAPAGGVTTGAPAAPSGGGMSSGLTRSASAAAASGGASSDKGDPIEAGPLDVPVEVCGVVQIYNPPDPEKLGSGGAADPSKRATGLPANPVTPPRASGGGGTGGGRMGLPR